MILTILFGLITFATWILGVELAAHPPSPKNKKWYYLGFTFLAIVGIGLAVIQYLAQDKKDKATTKQLHDIQSNTDKPFLQLSLNTFTVINGKSTPTLDGLAVGRLVQLKQLRDISLLISVYGTATANGLNVEMVTPWTNPNITGDAGWVEKGQVHVLFAEPKTYMDGNLMAWKNSDSTPPNQSVALPLLHIPKDYPSKTFPIKFKIYSNDSQVQDIGVMFQLD